MYQKGKYIKENRGYVFEFIQSHPFATFVLKGDKLLGTHIPVLTEGDPNDFRLFGHISNEYNKQINYLEDGRKALLIFHGAQAYISSSWYEKKSISTWDYSAVHINVKLKVQTEKELEESLKKLVERFEREQESPLYFDEIPHKMIRGQIPFITGFWAEPFHIEAVAKLHQGYRKEDVESSIKHLENSGDPIVKQLGKCIRKEHDEND